MVFLRSEEHLQRWLEDHGWQPGRTLTTPAMNGLANAWWRTRLDPDWEPRTVEQSQAILDGLGLEDEFWRLA